jgi:hypothetical protein
MFAGSSAASADAMVLRLNQAILGDLRRGIAEAEDVALIRAMIALAHFEQSHLETGSNTWKSVHIDWALELPSRLDGADEAEWKDARTLGLDHWFYAE